MHAHTHTHIPPESLSILWLSLSLSLSFGKHFIAAARRLSPNLSDHKREERRARLITKIYTHNIRVLLLLHKECGLDIVLVATHPLSAHFIEWHTNLQQD